MPRRKLCLAWKWVLEWIGPRGRALVAAFPSGSPVAVRGSIKCKGKGKSGHRGRM